MSEEIQFDRSEILALTTKIVSAYVSNNSTTLESVVKLIQSVFDRLAASSGDEPEPTEFTPAVPIKKSRTDDYIICLEDGKKLKMMQRHLLISHEMTPEAYREKWGLKTDYPMVAPAYSRKRQELAVKIGLGRRPPIVEAQPVSVPSPKGKRSRQKAAD